MYVLHSSHKKFQKTEEKMELINYIIKELEGESRAKRKDFLSCHALVDFRKCPEFFRKRKRARSQTRIQDFKRICELLKSMRLNDVFRILRISPPTLYQRIEKIKRGHDCPWFRLLF